MTARWRAGLVGVLAVLVSSTGLASPVHASEQPESDKCEIGKTQFIDQPSYNLSSLAFPRSWRTATGDGVVVAVVDSGVDPANQHLGRRVVLPGKSFVGGDPSGREDPYGHGTAIAGIIAAQYLGEKSSLIGAAPAAKILPVRVFQYEPSQPGESVPFPPDTGRIAQGIRWAVDNGADVINVSMSTGPKDPALGELKAATAYAHRKDVVVVASGGNQLEGVRTDELRFPAAAEDVIGVAGADVNGAVDDFSVHGPHNDVSAPGAQVLISFHANGDCLAGDQHPFTSWAAGFVSGLAAQLREKYPRASADEIAYRIMASADRPRLSQRDDEQGWGLIQPYEALTMTIDPTRAGPELPGARSAPDPGDESKIRPISATPDPLAPAREAALWWGLLAVGLAALALVLRPLTRRALVRRRRP